MSTSDSVTIESKEISYTFNEKDWNLFNNNTWIYKLESTVTGTGENMSTDTKILRKYSTNADFVEIGTLNKNKIVLNDEARPNEEQELGSFDINDKWEKNIKSNLGDDILVKINQNTDLNLTETQKKKLNEEIKGSNNTGNGNGNQNKLEDIVDNLEAGTKDLTEVQIEGRVFRKQYAHFCYPNDLRTNKQDRIRFEQIYTEGTKIDTNLTSNERAFQRQTKKVRGSVTLPIVTGIGDRTEVDWQGQTLNPLQSAGAAIALDVFNKATTTKGVDALVDAGTNAMSQAKTLLASGTVGGDVRSGINVWLAQKAVGAQGLLSRTTGAIVNPNLEMLFSGPKLRTFGFTFRLSARDVDEAGQVRKILRFFKQGMSVKTSASNVFLKAPNIFKIKYQTFNTEGDEITHPSLNIFKTCALTSCDVQYTPDGNYMTYEDPHRTLTSYQLSLSFSELDPIFDSDYTGLDNDKDTIIGY